MHSRLLLLATVGLLCALPAAAAAVPPPPGGIPWSPTWLARFATPAPVGTPSVAIPSDRRRLRLDRIIGGAISPKSVVATGTGEVWAQNETFRHTVTVYGSHGSLLRTISDRVILSHFGYRSWSSPVNGGPVEAAVSPDTRFVYVSQHSMYGPGFARPAPMSPECSPANGYDRSFVYRIARASRRVTAAYRVGSVPKAMAVTPDGGTLLVSNWCSYDLSVVDLARGREVRRIHLGPYPRGIVVTPDGAAAWVAVMGSSDLARIDLRTWHVSWLRDVGWNPRSLVIDPAGAYLYVTLDLRDEVVRIDLARRRVVARVHTGAEPRSMAISSDGRSLYVGNYEDDTVVKLRARDLRILQRVVVPGDPIGIAYEPVRDTVWVASYQGAIRVFRDR